MITTLFLRLVKSSSLMKNSAMVLRLDMLIEIEGGFEGKMQDNEKGKEVIGRYESL